MAMVRNVVTCLAVAALLMTVAKAKSYTVGDDDGWTAGPDYTTWASGKTFKVGDELVFTYLPNHDVLEVSKKDYETCSASSPISSDSSGSTSIPLTAAGKRYFICGTPGHCDMGQKLEIDTMGSSSSPPPPVATSLPSTPATLPPPPAIPPPCVSKETPTPKPSSAYTISHGASFAFALMMLAAI
ncbi:hypothetical protein QQ045_025850 [Rhodiola kirilowii]